MYKKIGIFLAMMMSVSAFAEDGVKIWFEKPAEYFEEALPIGNGRLGAMVYGGIQRDKISLNDITLWTGEPDKRDEHPDMKQLGRQKGSAPVEKVRALLEAEDYEGAEEAQKALQGHGSERYQPLGTLYINFKNAQEGTYRRELDLSTAVAKTTIGTRTVEYFASSPDSAIVIIIKDPKGADVDLEYECQNPSIITEYGEDGFQIDGYAAWHRGWPSSFDENRGIHFKTIVSKTMPTPTECVIYIVNETSFDGFDKNPAANSKPYKQLVENNLSKLIKSEPEEIKYRAIADYKSYFDRLKLSLGASKGDYENMPTDQRLKNYTATEAQDRGLETLYFNYGRYLLISSSRTMGVPPNLQGLWNESMDPPWSCNYTININLEENFWPAEVAGLGDLHMAMLSFLKGLSINGSAAAKDFYNIGDGLGKLGSPWATGHNTDIWAMATPVGMGNEDTCWSNWTMGGTWLVTHIWEHYLFARDKNFLKEYYPILKGAAQFCLEWMVEKDGELITSPGTSPENKYKTPSGFVGATLYGSTADLAFIRECLTDASEAAKVLSTDRKFRKNAAKALKRLRPYHIGAKGNLQEWYYDWEDAEPQHRHQSHLFGLYPGHQITPETTPDLAKACAKTLEIKGDNTTGWSTGWRVNLYARLQDAENAYHFYRRLLRNVSPDGYNGDDAVHAGGTYPNLFDAHPPFQIDGNFGGCAGVLEMLVQSSEDEIWLLPACPEQWSEGSLSGVHTRTGAVISFSWKDGKVTDYKILNKDDKKISRKIQIHM